MSNVEDLKAGNALPVYFPTAKAGDLYAVCPEPLTTGSVGRSRVFFVIRNSTDAGLSDGDISAAFRDDAGRIATTGMGQSTLPAQLATDVAALSHICFDRGANSPPKDATSNYFFQKTEANTKSHNTVSFTTHEPLSGTTGSHRDAIESHTRSSEPARISV